MSTLNLKRKFNKAHAVMTFIMACAFYTILLASQKIVPFGDNTWISFDMKRQYVDFYAYFKSVLAGDNNIFYSFDTALGAGVIGLCVYYLTSPFLFILAFFKAEALPLGISIVIGLKLAASAVTFDLMLQKLCGKSAYICSLSYAFCAYMLSNAMNLMWLDVLIMLPVVILMTEHLIHEGRLLGYTVSVALILYLNYYIAYILLIFVLLWSVARLFAEKDRNPQEVILRLGIATGGGIGIDAFILLPTFIELFNSPKDIFEYGLRAEASNLSPVQIVTKMFSLSYDSLEIYWGKPLIFCGVTMITLSILYFLNKRIGIREKLSMGFLLLVLAISFAFDDINIMWHAGMEPSGYPYREAILFVFVMLICACRSLKELRDGTDIKSYILLAVIMASALIWIKIRPAAYMDDSKLIINTIVTCVSVILIFVLSRVGSGKLALAVTALIMLVQTADLGLNGVYIYRMESMMGEKSSEFSDSVDRIGSAVEDIKGMNPGFYRMETWTPRQQNDAMMHDYKGITHYSSAGLTYVRFFLQKMGYNDDGLYTDYGHDNTETADSLLGIRYLMTDSAHGFRMHKDYELVRDGEVQVYENPYALPVAVGVYREMSGETLDPFSLQEDIYGRLSGEPVDIFIPANVHETESDAGRPIREYRVIAEADGEMYFYMSDLIGSYSNLEIYYNNEFLTYYGNDSCLKVLNLGYYEKGDFFMVHVKADDSSNFGEGFFVTEDTEALHDAYDATIMRHADVQSISASKLAMTLDSAYTVGDDLSGEVGVFTTIPYEKGWKVEVSGVKTEPVEVYDALMYIPVTKAIQQAELGPGEDIRIELSYVPEGFYLGVVVSILSIVGIILMASIRKGEAGFFGDSEDLEDDESLYSIPETDNREGHE